MTCFIAILALLLWSGTRPAISSRYAYIMLECSSDALCRTDVDYGSLISLEKAWGLTISLLFVKVIGSLFTALNLHFFDPGSDSKFRSDMSVGFITLW